MPTTTTTTTTTTTNYNAGAVATTSSIATTNYNASAAPTTASIAIAAAIYYYDCYNHYYINDLVSEYQQLQDATTEEGGEFGEEEGEYDMQQ